MKEYSSGSKSDGYTAYLFIAPKQIFKLYREDILPFMDTFFNEYHLKYVSVSGIFHERINSIKVEKIELVNDPFLSSINEQEEEVKNDEE